MGNCEIFGFGHRFVGPRKQEIDPTNQVVFIIIGRNHFSQISVCKFISLLLNSTALNEPQFPIGGIS
jgi:hypothetical protein